MRFLSTFTAKSAGFAIALCALATVASASQIRLHMPLAARWGSAILPPGDYKLDVAAGSAFGRVSGNGKVATVFVTSVGYQPTQKHGYLKIVNVNGTPTVAAFGSNSEGVLYEFAVPTSSPHAQTAMVKEPAHGW